MKYIILIFIYFSSILFVLDISLFFFERLSFLKWSVFGFMALLPLILFRKLRISFDVLSILVLLYFSSIFFSTIINSSITHKSVSYLIAYGMLLLFFVTLTRLDSSNISKFYFSGISTVIIVTLLFNLPLVPFAQFYEAGRFRGLFENPNSIAGFASLGVGLVLGKICLTNRSDTKKYFTLWIFIICVIILILVTKSRASLSISIILLLAYMVLENRSAVKIKVLIMVLSLGALYFYQNLSLLLGSNVEIAQREFLNFSNREAILTSQWQTFMSKPVFGAGLVIDSNADFARFGGELSYTDILSYGGIVGFSILTTILSISVLRSIRWREETLYVFYPLLAIILLSIFEGYISNVGSLITIFYWVILAFLSSNRLK